MPPAIRQLPLAVLSTKQPSSTEFYVSFQSNMVLNKKLGHDKIRCGNRWQSDQRSKLDCHTGTVPVGIV